MFFVRLLLLFAALYFSPVQADDFTKRISQDHHSKIDHDTLSLNNPSRLATLAAIHKEKQSQFSSDDDHQKKSNLRKNYSIAISSPQFDQLQNIATKFKEFIKNRTDRNPLYLTLACDDETSVTKKLSEEEERALLNRHESVMSIPFPGSYDINPGATTGDTKTGTNTGTNKNNRSSTSSSDNYLEKIPSFNDIVIHYTFKFGVTVAKYLVVNAVENYISDLFKGDSQINILDNQDENNIENAKIAEEAAKKTAEIAATQAAEVANKIAHENSLRTAAEKAEQQIRDEEIRAKSLRDLIEQEIREKNDLEQIEKIIRIRIKDKEEENDDEEIVSTPSNLTGPSLFATVPVLVWVIGGTTGGTVVGPFVAPVVGVIYVAVTAAKIMQNYKKNNGGGDGDDDEDKKKKKDEASEKAIADAKKAKTDKAKDTNQEKYDKRQEQFSKKADECKKNAATIEKNLLQKGLQRHDDLLPTPDKKSGFAFDGIVGSDGKFIRDKDGNYLDKKGNLWKLNSDKTKFDVTTPNGSHIFVSSAGPNVSTKSIQDSSLKATFQESQQSSEQPASDFPSKTTAQEPQQPKQQGCGKPHSDAPATPIHTGHGPQPAIEQDLPGCGKPHPDAPEIRTHTGHGLQPEISRDLPGCGQSLPGLEDAHQQPGCGGMDVADQKPDTFQVVKKEGVNTSAAPEPKLGTPEYKNKYPNGKYRGSDKHHPNSPDSIGKPPKDGQKALDNSVPVKGSTQRVTTEDGKIVILKYEEDGIYHGYLVEDFHSLKDGGVRKALLDNELVRNAKSGKVL